MGVFRPRICAIHHDITREAGALTHPQTRRRRRADKPCAEQPAETYPAARVTRHHLRRDGQLEKRANLGLAAAEGNVFRRDDDFENMRRGV
jgi:hypothetical protein